MKKILFVGYVLLTTIACNAQIKTTTSPRAAMTIKPVEQKRDIANSNQNGIPDDTYLKDVNHLLDKYIGTWKGATSAYNYEFRITVFMDVYGNLMEDRLAIRYIITDLNGAVIENTTALPNDSPYIIKGRFFVGVKYNNYSLNYIGKEANCGQEGEMRISCNSNIASPTDIKVNYFPSIDIFSGYNCPSKIRAKEIMPVDGVLLYKQ